MPISRTTFTEYTATPANREAYNPVKHRFIKSKALWEPGVQGNCNRSQRLSKPKGVQISAQKPEGNRALGRHRHK